MNELLWFGGGVLFAEITQRLIRFWRQNEDKKRREQSAQILKKHGLTAQLYLATIGETDDELRAALDTYAFSGYIITNVKGDVVGKMYPKVEKGRHLRLVVSNT